MPPVPTFRYTRRVPLRISIVLALCLLGVSLLNSSGEAIVAVVPGAAMGVVTYVVSRVRPLFGLIALALLVLFSFLALRPFWITYLATGLGAVALLNLVLPLPRRSAARGPPSLASEKLSLISGVLLFTLGLGVSAAVVIVVASELPYLIEGVEASATIEQTELGPRPSVATVHYRFSTSSGVVIHGVGTVPTTQLNGPLSVVYVGSSPSHNQPKADLLLFENQWQLLVSAGFAAAALTAGLREIYRTSAAGRRPDHDQRS